MFGQYSSDATLRVEYSIYNRKLETVLQSTATGVGSGTASAMDNPLALTAPTDHYEDASGEAIRTAVVEIIKKTKDAMPDKQAAPPLKNKSSSPSRPVITAPTNKIQTAVPLNPTPPVSLADRRT